MTKLKQLLCEEIDHYEIEDFRGIDPIVQYLTDHDEEPEVIKLGSMECVIWGNYIIDDPDFPDVQEKQDWLWSTSGQRLVKEMMDLMDDKFNQQFWERPEYLYHGTPSENVDNIKQKGLSAEHKSRGLANRHINRAVFTSTEHDGVVLHYGDSVIEINTIQMKNDGFMPHVTKEPNHEESDVINFIARKIGMDDERDHSMSNSEGTTDDTRIVHDGIPPKYLSFEMA